MRVLFWWAWTGFICFALGNWSMGWSKNNSPSEGRAFFIGFLIIGLIVALVELGRALERNK